jgi:hypothetical protein
MDGKDAAAEPAIVPSGVLRIEFPDGTHMSQRVAANGSTSLAELARLVERKRSVNIFARNLVVRVIFGDGGAPAVVEGEEGTLGSYGRPIARLLVVERVEFVSGG